MCASYISFTSRFCDPLESTFCPMAPHKEVLSTDRNKLITQNHERELETYSPKTEKDHGLNLMCFGA